MFRIISVVAVLAIFALANGIVAATSNEEPSQPVVPVAGSFENEPLVIIVNKSNPVDNISFEELRNIFLAERRHWSNGRNIVLVMRNPGQPERAKILKLVYRMSESSFNRHFLQASFTGNNQEAPKLLATSAGVRRFVFHVPGAIGYVQASELDDSVKPVRIDGRSPSDPGYRIR